MYYFAYTLQSKIKVLKRSLTIFFRREPIHDTSSSNRDPEEAR